MEKKYHTYRDSIPENSKYIIVDRNMLQNEPELWLNKARKKYVLVIYEKDHSGKKYRRNISTGTNNKQDAKDFKTNYISELSKRGSKNANPHSVDSALNFAFSVKRDSQRLQNSSCKEIERGIRFFTEFIGKETGDNLFPIQLIGFELCNAFLLSIEKPRQQIKHRANLSSLWNTIIDYQEKYGILDNPFKRTKKARLPESDPEQLTEQEFRKLYEEFRTPTFQMQMYKLVCAFSYYTGLRLGEVCYIRSEHATGNTVKVRSYSDHSVKNKQNRDVPITTKVREILDDILKLKSQHKSVRVRETEYLFCTEKGNPLIPNNVTAFFTENRKGSLPNRSKVSFHSLRRSFGQNLLNMNVSIAMVSRLYGHSSIAVTEKSYANSHNIPLDNVRALIEQCHAATPPLERISVDKAPTKEDEEISIASLLKPFGIFVGESK